MRIQITEGGLSDVTAGEIYDVIGYGSYYKTIIDDAGDSHDINTEYYREVDEIPSETNYPIY